MPEKALQTGGMQWMQGLPLCSTRIWSSCSGRPRRPSSRRSIACLLTQPGMLRVETVGRPGQARSDLTLFTAVNNWSFRP